MMLKLAQIFNSLIRAFVKKEYTFCSLQKFCLKCVVAQANKLKINACQASFVHKADLRKGSVFAPVSCLYIL